MVHGNSFQSPGADHSAGLVIRIQSASMAGRNGPTAMALPMQAQIGGDGSRVQLRVGDNPIPLPPGQWPVTVWCSYYGIKTGGAQLTVETRTDRPVLVYYMVPRTIYDRGVLAYEPTERPGGKTLLLMYAAAPLVVLFAVVLALLIR